MSETLAAFAAKIIKRKKIYIPRMNKKGLIQMAAVCKEIQERGLPKYLVLRKLQGNLGSGIFLHPKAEPIVKKTVIAPYAGEVILAPQYYEDNSDYVFCLISDIQLSKEETHLLAPKQRYHPRRTYSLDLDAHKIGNFTRFINHSAEPNVEAHFVRIPPNSVGLTPALFEVVYVARRVIRPGEQLLVCYEGDDQSYWGAMNIKPFAMGPRTFRLNSALKVHSNLLR